MQFHLFGASTPSGEAFQQLATSTVPGMPLLAYSRKPAVDIRKFHYMDFKTPSSFRPAGKPGSSAIWISFGPIWLLAPFLEQLALEYPERLEGLRGLIACSSSSAFTKRFSANPFDRELVARLTRAEDQLLATCRRIEVQCNILRPTLVYGKMGPYEDQNISRLLQLIRLLPLLPLPANSGLRQPIHALQLAGVALELAQQISLSNIGSLIEENSSWPNVLALGGDQQLSYTDMLHALQQALPHGDPGRRCRLLMIPNRLFFFLAAPLLLLSPKTFEAVLRIGVDLAGFTQSNEMLGQAAKPFPVQPFA